MAYAMNIVIKQSTLSAPHGRWTIACYWYGGNVRGWRSTIIR